MRIFLAAVFVLAGVGASADSIPLTAVNKASAVIDRAIKAYGGAEVLAGISTAVQQGTFTNFATYQSRRPGPPWDKSTVARLNVVDFAQMAAYTSNQGEGGGFVTDGATLLTADGNYNINRRQNTLTPIPQADFNATVGPFVRITPVLLVRNLMQRRHTSHWLGEAEVDGAKADIVTLVMEVGPALSLYIDQKSGLLSKAERVFPPFGQVEYRYLDYKEVDGIPVHQRFELFANGEPNMTAELGPLKLNQPVDQYFSLPADMLRREAVPPDPLSASKLAEGVYLVGGSGTYALFVESEGEVIAIGGTAGIAQRIKELRNQGVDGPVRYGVLTHHHNDHLLGVAAYADEGAEMVGHQAHEAVIRGTVEREIMLTTVADRHSLGSGANRVELYDIGPTPHVEHVLVAYLPQHKMLFQADHSGIGRTGPVGKGQPVTVALHAAVKRLGLDVNRYVSAHSPRVLTQAELDEAVRRATEAD